MDSLYYHGLQHGIYQLTEVKSKSVLLWQVGLSLILSQDYDKIFIAPKSPVEDITFCQQFVKSVASEKATILIIKFTWSRML